MLAATMRCDRCQAPTSVYGAVDASSSREASATRTTIATHPLASARGARLGHLRVHVGLCDGVELLRPRPAVVVVASRMRTLMLAAQGSVVDAGRSARLSWRRT